jgi:ribose/xylose/arabinose/galactoside ABC-type transport system permease subunit
VLLGGTSLFGGAGGVGGTVFGVLFIGVLQNGLSIAGVQSFWQQVVTGLILVLAVLGDRITAAGGLRRFALTSQLRLLRGRHGTADVPPVEGAA